MNIDKDTWRSPNFNERVQLSPDRAEPSMVILHYTGMESAKAALSRLCDPAAEVSAHYVIDEGGAVFQLVEDEHRAWHAGKSYWEGLTDINSASIGIEIVNKGHEFGYENFPGAQMVSLKALLKDLVGRYNISADKILGHSDIAPERKIDPGEKFPWKDLALEGFGLWPDVLEMDIEAAAELLEQEEVLYDLLVNFGYSYEASYETLIEAFHRHYFPEKFLEGASVHMVNVGTISRILALTRQKNELESKIQAGL